MKGTNWMLRTRSAIAQRWLLARAARPLTPIVDALAGLLDAGLPLGAALAHLEGTHLPARQQRYVGLAADSVQRGETLAQVWRPVVPAIFAVLLAAGERTGSLAKVLHSWTDHQARRKNFVEQFTRLLSYPLLLTAVTSALLIFISQVVFPAFYDMYRQLGLPVSSTTLAIESTLQVLPWLLLGLTLLALVAPLVLVLVERRFPRQWRRISVRVPGLRLRRLSRTSFFCELLEMLLSAGIPIADALHQLASLDRPVWFSTRCLAMEQAILNGDALRDAFAGDWDPTLVWMMAWAEQTGELPSACERVRLGTERAFISRMQRLARVLGPTLLVLMGSLVGFTMYALFVPMYDLTSIISAGGVHG